MTATYQQGDDLAQRHLASQMPWAVGRKRASCSFSCLLTDVGNRFPEAKHEGQTCLAGEQRVPCGMEISNRNMD